MYATRAIIRLDYFEHNLQQVKSLIPAKTKVCVPVKANAYGHGSVQIAQKAIQCGADFLAVATVHEGVELRNAHITAPILCFIPPLPDEIPLLFEYNLTPFVGDKNFLNLLVKHDEHARHAHHTQLDIHLKIDTGMARGGFSYTEAPEYALFITQQHNLRLTGVATHFACADSKNPTDIAYTQQQIERFNSSIKSIRQAGITDLIVHAANSGATILHPQTHFDMVRTGLMLYGYSDKTLLDSSPSPISLKPVMQLQSKIISIRELKKGEYVSYGATWKAPADTRIATIPIGYADGLPRALSNNFSVSIRGKAYPLVGRICMDQCLIDIKQDNPIECFDDVLIMAGDAPFDANDIAQKCNTIAYEITCSMSKRIIRIYS
ncbi:MAG: alanine racemase [Treponemataceae bacterium]